MNPGSADPLTMGPSPIPHDLPGLDRVWSRSVTVPDTDGTPRTWHLLDNGAEPVHGTVVCVHGNPTWSYLWRRLLAEVPAGWRVIAPDHLGMGYSERTESPRSVGQRVADLGTLTAALGIDGPVVTVGHDWGGIISLGWALEHRAQLRGVVLGNTAVAQPPGDLGPPLIRLADTPGVRPFGCVATPTFVRGTTALSKPALDREVRDAFALPYGSRQRRRAVGDFVADIPFSHGHPSYETVAGYAEGVSSLDVPALFVWGPRDPVFGQRYLADMLERMPHAKLHRFENASHLVTEDAPQSIDAITAWLAELDQPRSAAPAPPTCASSNTAADTAWSWLERRSEDRSPVVSTKDSTVSWAALSRRVADLAAGMAAAGIRRGDRIGLLVEPSADLTSVVYAAWRVGAVVVIADRGLGFTGIRRALRGARLQHVIAGAPGLAAAQAMGLPGTRISVTRLGAAARRTLSVDHDLNGLARLGQSSPAPAEPDPEDECAVVFTSGATGPAKGVVYRHRQLIAQVDLVRRTYDLGAEDRFVAAFAPFSILGPAMGLGSAVPNIDITAPDGLTSALLAEAVRSIDARVVFASPAALRRVVATRNEVTSAQRTALCGVRLLMSAGAPVPVSLLESVAEVLPNARLHTPYGMTEAMPVTDVSLAELHEAGPGEGVCVGRPLAGVAIGVAPLPNQADHQTEPSTTPGVTGEVCVRSAHVKDRYDDRWLTEHQSSRYPGWHRTGDVGHLDAEARVWIEGRLAHLVTTAAGDLTPVGIEQRVEAISRVRASAAVGVGPAGTQVLVVVVVPDDAPTSGPRGGSLGLKPAAPDLTDAVRKAAGAPVAAVLRADRLPLDIRHAAKVDRTEVACQASLVLAGKRG